MMVVRSPGAMGLPLLGIRVLDATSNIAGPFGGTILGDLGATVIKIETPSGDPSRSMAPLDGDRSAYFHIVNRNKIVEEIDLKSENGKVRIRELLDTTDIFLTNFLPLRLQSLNLSPTELMAQRPALIIGNLSSYGSCGPSASWPGYDATVQARTGIMHITGEMDGSPVRTGISVLDIGSGMWLALGILAALVKRNRTGIGGLVETSLYETGVSWVSYHLAANELTHRPSVRSGSGHPTFSPYGTFATMHGDICIGVGNDNIFSKLATVINRSDLISDPRFIKNIDRVTHAAELKIEIENSLASQNSTYWTSLFAEVGVPADVVVAPESLFTDPQAAAVGILIDYPDSTAGITTIPGLPLRFDGKRPQIRIPAPHKKNKIKPVGDSGQQLLQ